MHSSPAAIHQLAIIGRSPSGQPRTFRLERADRPASSRDAGYRRLVAAIVGLDVPSLALELRAARLRQPVAPSHPRAA